MSNYRFGCDDYHLSYDPPEASDGCGGTDWEKVESVEIDGVTFVRERECEPKWTLDGATQTQEFWRCECGNCGYVFGIEDRSSFPFKMTIDKVEIPNYCPGCGTKQKAVS